MSLSLNGDYLLVSYWNRKGEDKETGFALLRISHKGLSLMKDFKGSSEFKGPSWYVFFARDGATFLLSIQIRRRSKKQLVFTIRIAKKESEQLEVPGRPDAYRRISSYSCRI